MRTRDTFTKFLTCVAVATIAATLACGRTDPAPTPRPGMVWIPSGAFAMGSTASPESQPVHDVRIDGF